MVVDDGIIDEPGLVRVETVPLTNADAPSPHSSSSSSKASVDDKRKLVEKDFIFQYDV
jgi:hypothetical protein